MHVFNVYTRTSCVCLCPCIPCTCQARRLSTRRPIFLQNLQGAYSLQISRPCVCVWERERERERERMWPTPRGFVLEYIPIPECIYETSPEKENYYICIYDVITWKKKVKSPVTYYLYTDTLWVDLCEYLEGACKSTSTLTHTRSLLTHTRSLLTHNRSV